MTNKTNLERAAAFYWRQRQRQPYRDLAIHFVANSFGVDDIELRKEIMKVVLQDLSLSVRDKCKQMLGDNLSWQGYLRWLDSNKERNPCEVPLSYEQWMDVQKEIVEQLR